MIGQTVLATYRILESWARAGWAWCTRRQDLRLERAVALKFLLPMILSARSDKPLERVPAGGAGYFTR